MYLFFDTETTGTPRNYKAPVTDLNNWPRLVQVAWILQDKNGNTIGKENFIIKPVGFTIPTEASNIHGITTTHAQNIGVELVMVLKRFCSHLDSSQYLIAHNISFDQNIMGAELIRSRINNSIPNKKLLCTMSSSINYCAINGPYGYKWPKLIELHKKLFGYGFDGAHDAFGYKCHIKVFLGNAKKRLNLIIQRNIMAAHFNNDNYHYLILLLNQRRGYIRRIKSQKYLSLFSSSFQNRSAYICFTI